MKKAFAERRQWQLVGRPDLRVDGLRQWVMSLECRQHPQRRDHSHREPTTYPNRGDVPEETDREILPQTTSSFYLKRHRALC